MNSDSDSSTVAELVSHILLGILDPRIRLHSPRIHHSAAKLSSYRRLLGGVCREAWPRRLS